MVSLVKQDFVTRRRKGHNSGQKVIPIAVARQTVLTILDLALPAPLIQWTTKTVGALEQRRGRVLGYHGAATSHNQGVRAHAIPAQRLVQMVAEMTGRGIHVARGHWVAPTFRG
jgi:hypothetical protein